MVKTPSNLFQKFWITQRKPILFFGFLILTIVLVFYSSYSNTITARKWSTEVTKEVTQIESQAILLTKETEISTKKKQLENLLNQINTNSKIAQSQDDQVNLKSYNLKSYYLDYLDIHKKNLSKIESNLVIGSELEKLDGWDTRIQENLDDFLNSSDRELEYSKTKTKIIQQYESGKELESKLEDYIKQSTDTVLIGKLVTCQDYYKSIINWYEKIDWLRESITVSPTREQIITIKTDLENLIKTRKSIVGLFTQVTPSSVFTADLINSKNTLIKIVKRVTE